MAIPLVQLLSTNGDGTGTVEMTGNYASAAETFEIAAPAGEAGLTIARVIVYVEDTGQFDAANYGNGITLTNGITMAVRTSTDALVTNLTPTPIKSSGDWAALCYDVSALAFGIGNEILVARFSFNKFASGGLRLDRGDRLVVTVNDDMTGLVGHRVIAQGEQAGAY